MATNLTPSSQAGSCTAHGFPAAEVGPWNSPAPQAFVCLYPGCGAAFSDVGSLELHVKGHDFGSPGLPDRVASASGAGYGGYSVYGNDTFMDDAAANVYTGSTDTLSGFLGHKSGANPYIDGSWNPTYAAPPPMGDVIDSTYTTHPVGSPLTPGAGGRYNTTGAPTNSAPSRFVCPHPACSRTFGRPSDLARHAKKHELNPVRYPCPVPRCQFVGSKAFLRHDKLLNHGRNAHGMQL